MQNRHGSISFTRAIRHVMIGAFSICASVVAMFVALIVGYIVNIPIVYQAILSGIFACWFTGYIAETLVTIVFDNSDTDRKE